MHLLYLTFGKNIQNHIQAQFSIFSFMVQKKEISSINVITDQPDFYINIKDNVNVIAVNHDTLQKWKGEYDFFWRIKIKAIEMLCSLYVGEPVLYLDSDTFLFGDLAVLTEGHLLYKAYMHENEGVLSLEKSKTARKMWMQIKGRNYAGITILANHCMWNAGVVFVPNKKQNRENTMALEICDEMCRQGVTRRLIEQFAITAALQEVYGLQAADNVIGHYWSNKTAWDNLITEFLLSCTFKAYSNAQIATALKDLDFSQLPVKVKIRSSNARLKALVDKAYPAKIVAFAEKTKLKVVQ